MDADVWSLAVSGDAVYLGGTFTTVGGTPRRRLADVSAVAGDFVHRTNGNVRAMTVEGGRLFVGGGFTSVDGHSPGHLAAFDLAGGDLVGRWSAVGGRHRARPDR